MRNEFKNKLLELAEKDKRVVLLLGDISVFMMRDFEKLYPERFYNVGICENTIISVAAGISSQGFVPFAHTIAPFLAERSYEQIKLDMCYNKFAGNIVTCGGSFDYAWDGATHHCYTDLQLMRMLPGMEVMQPGNKKEFGELISSQYDNNMVSYFRIAADEHDLDFSIKFGKGNVVIDKGADITIVTAGPILGNVYSACSDLKVNLLYFHTIKPIDKELLSRYSKTKILVIHDAFGLFEAVVANVDTIVKYHGLPDRFCDFYGTLEDIREKIGLDAKSIRTRIKEELKNNE